MLVPLAQNDEETQRRLKPENRKKRRRAKALSKTLQKAWESAINVTPRDVAAYQPSHADIAVAEALTLGNTSLDDLTKQTSLKRERVREILSSPVSMAWISEQCERLFKLRKGIVDAALYTRAVQGDIAAMKLYYERTEILAKQPVNQINIGEINYEACTDDDLIKILHGRLSSPEGQIIDLEPGRDYSSLEGAEDTRTEAERGAVSVFSAPVGETSEATRFLPTPEGGEEKGELLRGQQVGQDDGGQPPGPGELDRIQVLGGAGTDADGERAAATEGTRPGGCVGPEARRGADQGAEQRPGDHGLEPAEGDRADDLPVSVEPAPGPVQEEIEGT